MWNNVVKKENQTIIVFFSQRQTAVLLFARLMETVIVTYEIQNGANLLY